MVTYVSVFATSTLSVAAMGTMTSRRVLRAALAAGVVPVLAGADGFAATMLLRRTASRLRMVAPAESGGAWERRISQTSWRHTERRCDRAREIDFCCRRKAR